MPREFSRSQRVAAQIQRELAQLVRDEVKDPRLSTVTFCGVDVSRDLAYAKVYVAVLGKDQKETEDVVVALNKAAAFLRRSLAGRLKMRVVPALQFRYDESLERGARLSALIDQALGDDNPDQG